MNNKLTRRRYFIGFVFGLASALICFDNDAANAELSEASNFLLMITSDSCPWCEAFEEEIGDGYRLTEEGKLLPLARLDYFHEMPTNLRHISPAIMTPTFIVIRDGDEVGRIVGYPGAELFWWRLSEFFGN